MYNGHDPTVLDETVAEKLVGTGRGGPGTWWTVNAEEDEAAVTAGT